MVQKILIGLVILMSFGFANAGDQDGSLSVLPQTSRLPPPGGIGGAYYEWGRGRDGSGYCYQFTSDGYVLNGGAPQPNFYCEQVHPSHSDWGRGNNGFGYCYQFTPTNIIMNQGAAIPNVQCELVMPSFYRWGRGYDGFTYCFQFTPNGLLLNDGRAVPNNYCY